MKLENQVCNLDLAKKLKALNVKQDSYFTWYLTRHHKGDFFNVQKNGNSFNCYDEKIASAFTVAELGEMLEIHRGEFRPQYANETEADYRAKHLIYLIEKGLLKP